MQETDVRRLHRCAEGAHVVFIGTSGLGSMVMRGQLTNSLLNQSFALHGARSSYITVTSPTNTSFFSTMIESHFDQIGGPSACVIIKYSVAWVGAACRRRGALVLVDSIDNFRAYSKSTLANEHYSAMDGIIVQTEFHASLVASWGHVAVLLPHPHGNLNSWSVADGVRERVRGVGFVMQDSKNMPTNVDMHKILRGCCRANTTLYLVSSRSDGLQVRPYTHRNCTNGLWDDGAGDTSRGGHHKEQQQSQQQYVDGEQRSETARSSLSPCVSRFGMGSNGGEHTRKHGGGTGFATRWSTFGSHLTSLADPTRQKRYYDAQQVLDLIDVGVVWRPGHQQGGKIAVDNRPPTRMHWWWSHGIPVIGYPMQAYLDAARRAGYPEELLNLTTSTGVEQALRQIDAAEERSCLQRMAHRGAELSSPWYASVELLAAICDLGERCGTKLLHGGRSPSAGSHARAAASRLTNAPAYEDPAAALAASASVNTNASQDAVPAASAGVAPGVSADTVAVDTSIFAFPREQGQNVQSI